MKFPHTYDQLPEKEGGEVIYNQSNGRQSETTWWQRRAGILLTIFNVAVFLMTVTTVWFGSSGKETMNHLAKKVSWYSPVFDRVEIPILAETYDNTLYAHSPLAALPSPETDKAWDDLARIRLLLVTDEEVTKMGKDPAYTVKHPHRENANVAVLAVDHQLHCLDSLRQNMFKEYYYPNGTDVLHMDHMLHCLDLLAQTLQCHADMDVITYNWWEHATDPVPDFMINMKCRDFKAYRDFTNKPLDESGFFQATEEGWAWPRPGGELNVTAPRQWWDLQYGAGRITKEEMEAKWGHI